MKKEVKKKWLKALRSGEYDQCKRQLLDRTAKGDQFCCLGVLCNLYAKEHPGTGFKSPKSPKSPYWDFFNKTSDLPAKVKKWAGISIEPLFIIDEYSRRPIKLTPSEKLIEMNDEQGKNFNQIADWIEENL